LTVVFATVTILVKGTGVGPGSVNIFVVEFVIYKGLRGNYERTFDDIQGGL
jgi:hypothetical protein